MANTDMMAGGVNKMVAMIGGAVLAIVGVIGFFNQPVLGLFDVNILHNLVHLVTGGILLWAAYANNGANARMTLLVIGVIYAVVAILGFVAPALTVSLLGEGAAPILYDNVLHLLLAIVFIAVPLMAREESTRPMMGRPQM